MSRRSLVPVNVLVSASAPTTPTLRQGDVYYNSTDSQLYVYSGATWSAVSAASSSAAPIVSTFSAGGDLVVRTGTYRLYVDRTATLTKVRASVGTAPTGSAAIIAYKVNGTKIASVTIAAGSYTTLSTTSLSITSGDYFTIDVEQVGSTIPGADLTVSLTLE